MDQAPCDREEHAAVAPCVAGRRTIVFASCSSLTSRAVPLQDSRGDEARLKEAVAKHGLQVLAGPGFFETGESR